MTLLDEYAAAKSALENDLVKIERQVQLDFTGCTNSRIRHKRA